MEKLMNILLQRNDCSREWGFVLAVDCENQMVIDRVRKGTISSHYMHPGDAVLQIAGRSTKAMTVEKARYLIDQSGNAVQIIIKKRPQGMTWTQITPSTPTFNPTKFTPSAENTTWKPSIQPPNRSESQETNVILGSVQQDPSGGFVHTFGTPKKPSTPQTASSGSSENAPWQNYRPSPNRQESVASVSSPKYFEEFIVSSPDMSNQYRSPVRQMSHQSNPSQFSPVNHSPQRGDSGTVSYPIQNNGFDSGSPVTFCYAASQTPPYQTDRQSSTPHFVRQDSVPYQTQRQDSIPYHTQRQESVPYQTQRQEPVPYQTQRQDSSSFQPNSWSSPARQDSGSFPPSRQESWKPVRQDSVSHSPSRQDSWANQSASNSYQPVRQDSWSNSPGTQNSSYPTNRQDSWPNQPARPDSVPFQPTGLFANRQLKSPASPEPSVGRYEQVSPGAAPGYQRQPSNQYMASPKSYSPSTETKPQEFKVADNTISSPNTYSVRGPFVRQQSTGPQPWSPAPAESFPTPPVLSPSAENARVPWPTSSELPTPPPPPLPSQPAPVSAPVVAPPPRPPPPPPPPPMPSSAGISDEVPAWKKQIKATKEAKAAAGITSQTPGTPSSGPELPAALAGSMKKDKKPFTYLPGGLDLSEIRSPKMQRRIMANQQQAPPPPSCMGQQVLLQPRVNGAGSHPQQLPNQFERLNLSEGQSGDRMATAVEAQRRPSADGQDPKTYGQSRSFRILQMMTGGDDATDSAEQPPPSGKREEEEMRFTGLRRPDNPIPSRAFQALQKMTSGNEESTPTDPRYAQDGGDDRQEEGPIDIRYKGGYIPGRSFKMLQEMTGMNENGVPSGTVVPSVLQEKRQQRKPPPHLHLSINQPAPPKQFPQPSVPASQQQAEEAPKIYRGGRIPSQSFRMLQAMTGESTDSQGEEGTDM